MPARCCSREAESRPLTLGGCVELEVWAVRPFPVVFHIGPMQVHTYGIGLAIAFWVGFRYFAQRLRKNGYPDAWLSTTFIWIVIASVVGARLVHILANLSYYQLHPGEIFAIWNGGLSSFGGLALALPIGMASAHRRCPTLRPVDGLDIVAPVLVFAWAIGRFLGPQFMVAGGGKPTQQWFGMYYAGQVGKRIPVPIIQGIECLAIFLILILVERMLKKTWITRGMIAALAMGLWGLSRFFDEYLWLTYDTGTDAVEIASICMFVAGMGISLWRYSVRIPFRTHLADGASVTTK
ncbi:MAG TPA: prolipoprotein diacylglyceryl transferase family protein [Acidimicrobiales bacterium]|nr:prolipoprotein diacylglyceryl transferase family protein [Acidimicrobiales bacterium]